MVFNVITNYFKLVFSHFFINYVKHTRIHIHIFNKRAMLFITKNLLILFKDLYKF